MVVVLTNQNLKMVVVHPIYDRRIIIFSVIFEINGNELENAGYRGFADVSFACLIVCCLFNICSYISFSAPVHDTVYNCLEERSGCDRKDQKILEKLRAERQAKIDELKEKTNYYTTQQLIQGLSFRLMGLVCSTVKAVKNKNMACVGNLMKMKSFVNRKVGCYSNPRVLVMVKSKRSKTLDLLGNWR
ncbi:hypothetical protein RIF29_03504 [Crotalaria pallida]|uniref:Uncharacterized protein n=1 Tax=Crotalaria pallida TaxID=3830 RepID=A0AAN9J008_CROPI